MLVDAASLDLAIVPGQARALAETGMRIVAAADRQIGFRHPENPEWSHFSSCQFTAPPSDTTAC